MSSEATSWVIKHSQHKGSNLLCLLIIANYAHPDGSNAFPSGKRLAIESRMSERQIKRIIDALETSGELVVDQSVGRVANRYRIVMAEPTMTSCHGDKNVNHDISDTSTMTSDDVNHDIPRAPARKSLSEKPIETKSETLFGDDAPVVSSKRFVPPSVQEVEAYAVEQGCPGIGEDFVDYWSSVGWMRGKTKMIDWRGTLRQRIRQLRENGRTQGQNGNGHTAPPPAPPKPEPRGRRWQVDPMYGDLNYEGSPNFYADCARFDNPEHRLANGWHKDQSGRWDRERWLKENEAKGPPA